MFVHQRGRLIDHVHTMTSISGGALPAFAFALANARNIDRVDSFKELYKSLVENNLGDQMLEHFNHSKDPERVLSSPWLSYTVKYFLKMLNSEKS